MKQALAVPRTKTIISSPTPERGGSPVCQSAFAKLPHQQQRARKKEVGHPCATTHTHKCRASKQRREKSGPVGLRPQGATKTGLQWKTLVCLGPLVIRRGAKTPRVFNYIRRGSAARKTNPKEAAPGGGEAGKGAVHGLGASRPFGGYRPQRPPPQPSQAFADRCTPSAALTSRVFPSAR